MSNLNTSTELLDKFVDLFNQVHPSQRLQLNELVEKIMIASKNPSQFKAMCQAIDSISNQITVFNAITEMEKAQHTH